jgi:hypothetical protein
MVYLFNCVASSLASAVAEMSAAAEPTEWPARDNRYSPAFGGPPQNAGPFTRFAHGGVGFKIPHNAGQADQACPAAGEVIGVGLVPSTSRKTHGDKTNAQVVLKPSALQDAERSFCRMQSVCSAAARRTPLRIGSGRDRPRRCATNALHFASFHPIDTGFFDTAKARCARFG